MPEQEGALVAVPTVVNVATSGVSSLYGLCRQAGRQADRERGSFRHIQAVGRVGRVGEMVLGWVGVKALLLMAIFKLSDMIRGTEAANSTTRQF